MSETQWVEVFRAGTHTASNGGEYTYSVADLQELVDTVNQSLTHNHRVPLVLGHPSDDEPAWGWLKEARRVGSSLFAKFRDVRDHIATAVNKYKNYQSVSPRIYPRDHPGNPTPGRLNFGHIGLLGASQPAVKGMQPVAFAEKLPAGLPTFEFSEITVSDFGGGENLGLAISYIAKIFELQRETLISDRDLEAANKVFPRKYLDELKELAGAMGSLMDRVNRLQAELIDLRGRSLPMANHDDYGEADWGLYSADFGEALGKLIGRLQTEKKVSNEDLAKAMGVDTSTLGGIKSGTINRPPDRRLQGAAQALGVPISRLMAALETDTPTSDNAEPSSTELIQKLNNLIQ